MGKTSLVLAEGEVSVQMEQRVPDSILSDQDDRLSGEAVSDTTSDYIVSLVVNRAASSTAMSQLEDFYVGGMGTTKTHDATENGATAIQLARLIHRSADPWIWTPSWSEWFHFFAHASVH